MINGVIFDYHVPLHHLTSHGDQFSSYSSPHQLYGVYNDIIINVVMCVYNFRYG